MAGISLDRFHVLHFFALFGIKRPLLKSTVTTKMFFATVDQLNGPLWKEQFIYNYFNRVKRSRLSVVIVRFRSILFAPVFRGS